ncbi:MAG: hypothetical protein RIR49_1920 [Actinomycetota bacterium]|jgi:hypothetical protein
MPGPDLRQAITAALAAAEWPHRDEGPPMAIGTSTIHDGRLVGGSIQPFDDIAMVRVIAFGEAGPPGDRVDEFHRLCGLVNPTLVDTTLELDADLGMPVCRATVRVTGDDMADAQAVFGALGRVTATFVRCVSGALAVIDDGLSALEGVDRIRGRG